MPPGTLRFFILPIAILLLIASQSLIVIARAWRRQGKIARCGACNYDISGTDVWQCPECGGDLRDVGITTPTLRSRQAVSLWQIIVAWITIAGFAYGLMVGVGAMGSYSWLERVERRTQKFSPRDTQLQNGVVLSVGLTMHSESEPHVIGHRMPGWVASEAIVKVEVSYEGETLATRERAFDREPPRNSFEKLARAALEDAGPQLATSGVQVDPDGPSLLALGIIPDMGTITFGDANFIIGGRRLPTWVNIDALLALAAIPFLVLALVGVVATQCRRRWLIRTGKPSR
jgi:hypothetical protein